MSDTLAQAAVLLPSSAQSSSNGTITGNVATWRSIPWFASCEVGVSIAPSSSGNATATLDVYLQHSVDYLLAGASSSNFSATWDDFLHFPQILSGPAKAQIACWTANVAPSSSMNTHTAATLSLAAGQVLNGALGGSWRTQAVIANAPTAGSSSQWTFQVLVQPYW